MDNRKTRRNEQKAQLKSKAACANELTPSAQGNPRKRFAWASFTAFFFLLTAFGVWKISVPAQAEIAKAQTAPKAQLTSLSSPASAPPAVNQAKSSGSEREQWILAPNEIPEVPQFGEVPPLPTASGVNDPNFHPVKVLNTHTFGNRHYVACLNPKTGHTEILVGKVGRDEVFSIANPVTGELPQTEIQDVKEGQRVATRNPETGKNEFKRVTRTFKKTATELVELKLANAKTGEVVDTIKGTPEHPFFVEGGSMVPMGKLKAGTKVLVHTGPALIVKSIKRETKAQGVPVYNLEVEEDHTYFVGKSSAWVHNNTRSLSLDEAREIAQHAMQNHAGDFAGTFDVEDLAQDLVTWSKMNPAHTSSTDPRVVWKVRDRNLIIIFDPRTGNPGSAFKPSGGLERYFQGNFPGFAEGCG